MTKDQQFSQLKSMFNSQLKKFTQHNEKFNRFLSETRETISQGNSKESADVFKFDNTPPNKKSKTVVEEPILQQEMVSKEREDIRFEAELQQRTELIQGRHQDMKNVHRLMKDVRGIAEDMHQELQF